MKAIFQFYSIPLIFCFLFPNQLTSQPVGKEKSLHDEVSEIFQNASGVDKHLKIDVKALADGVKKSILESNKISKKLSNVLNPNTAGKLTMKEKRELLDAMKQIYEIYKNIDDNRDQFTKLLLKYDENLDLQSQKIQNLINTYKQQLKTLEEQNLELSKKKPDISKREKQDLEFTEINIPINKAKIEKLEMVELLIDQIRRDYTKTNEEIMLFFNAVKNGTLTSKNLIEYFEFDIELEKILQSIDSVKNLNDLTKGIQDSLQNISESIRNLGKATDNL